MIEGECDRTNDGSSLNENSDESVAELTKQLTEQSTALASKEIELAKAELEAKGKQLGIGAGFFGAASPDPGGEIA